MFFLPRKGSERNSEGFLFRGTAGIPSEITICSVYSVFRGINFWSEIPNPTTTALVTSFPLSLRGFLLSVWQVEFELTLGCRREKTTSKDGEKYDLFLSFLIQFTLYSTFHHGEGEITDEKGGLGRLQALLNGRPAHKKALAFKNSLA